MFFFTENNQNSKANQSNSKSDINLTIKKIIYQQLLITLYKIIKMTRKEFFQKAGAGAALMLVPACIAGLATSCSKDSAATTSTNNPSGSNLPANIDFTIDVSTGNLAINGGSLVQNRVIVAKLLDGSGFIAVAAACTHAGTIIDYKKDNNTFNCSNHGSNFSATGTVLNGPNNGGSASNLQKFNTILTDNSLRVFS